MDDVNVSSLSGKCILIVEDDPGLAEGLKTLLKKYESIIVSAFCIDEAIELLINDSNKIDLIILDIMLPQTKEDYAKICDYQNKLKSLRAIFSNANISPLQSSENKRELTSAREDRKIILQYINGIIDPKGGIKILQAFIAEKSKEKLPPVIILSALGNDNIMKEGLELVNKGAWLVKPQTKESLLKSIVELLAKS